VNVLITSAARKVWLVRAFQEAIRRVGGGRVVAADVSPLAAALYHADGGTLVPQSDDARFIQAILDLCRRDAIGLVIPTRDEELSTFAQTRDRFAADGVLVLVAAPEAIAVCQDKRRFAAACGAAGALTPRTIEAPVPADLPLFIRPVRGKGGRGARAVRTAIELAAALDELGDTAFAQELVSGPEFTVDVFVDLDRQPISCVPRERILVVAGESQVARTVRDDILCRETLRLVKALGLVGHLTVQAFRRGDDVLFVEINPRYGGGAALGFAAGAFTPEWAVRLALGERLEPRLGDYDPDLVMLRYGEDRFLHTADLLAPISVQ